jgi:HAD superfamily hydrolase (TIGR01509 family)
MIKAVLFDLFETLITESLTPPIRASSLGEALGLDQAAFRVEWKARRPRVLLGSLSFGEALTEIAQTLTGTVDAAAVQRLCRLRTHEKAAAYARIDDEVMGLVTDLGRRGLGLGVVSNCFKEDVLAWSTCPLARHFHCVVFSFAEGVAKPDPEIYRRATRRLGIEPACALFIGDGGHNELYGAAQAGLRTFRAAWFVSEGSHRQSSDSGSTLRNRQEVLEIVAAG